MNINKPLVSIIMPCHNSIKYLEQSLASCLNQTYQNIEILLIENASTDNTLELCNDYASKYPSKVFVYQSKVGGMAGAARNLGIAKAKGEYVLFLDDDDELGLEAVENLVENAIKHDADAVYGDRKKIYLDGKVQITEHKSTIFYDDARFVFNLFATGFLYRKSYLLKNNICYTEGIISGEDVVVFIFTKLFANKIVILPSIYGIVYYYYVRDDSSVSYKSVDYTKTDIILEHVLNEFDKIFESTEKLKLVCGSFYGTKYQDVMIEKAKFYVFERLKNFINYTINRSSVSNPNYKTEALNYFSTSANYARLQKMMPNEVIIVPIVKKPILWYIKHTITMLMPPIITRLAKKILGK